MSDVIITQIVINAVLDVIWPILPAPILEALSYV